MKQIQGGVSAPKGFKAAGIHCGIRKNASKEDLALIVSDADCSAAAVYTQNKVKGAPIYVTRAHIADGHARAVICNSGNANTCNENGVEIAQKTCEILASQLNIAADDIIVASTGVIGAPLCIEPFEAGIPKLVKELSPDGGQSAARAIMTTDTAPKQLALEFEAGGKTSRLGAMGKGSGMINPNMATMLIFVTTDAAISPEMLQKALSDDVKDTFNQISVDGDTSTNDSVAVLANGMAQNTPITDENCEGYKAFCEALRQINTYMCRAIASDGEGATKLITCEVKNADSKETARKIAKSIISSSLFKAAIFGSDANWGRAICAIGYTEGDFSVDNINISLSSEAGDILVCKASTAVDFDEDKAKEILQKKEICVLIDMHAGECEATAWGCDLTYDYVKINGDYRS